MARSTLPGQLDFGTYAGRIAVAADRIKPSPVTFAAFANHVGPVECAAADLSHALDDENWDRSLWPKIGR